MVASGPIPIFNVSPVTLQNLMELQNLKAQNTDKKKSHEKRAPKPVPALEVPTEILQNLGTGSLVLDDPANTSGTDTLLSTGSSTTTVLQNLLECDPGYGCLQNLMEL